jgi:hypothetical protein
VCVCVCVCVCLCMCACVCALFNVQKREHKDNSTSKPVCALCLRADALNNKGMAECALEGHTPEFSN